MKLGIDSEDLQDLFLTRLDLMKYRCISEDAGNANPKLGPKLL
jgi:hypothetical protein